MRNLFVNGFIIIFQGCEIFNLKKFLSPQFFLFFLQTNFQKNDSKAKKILYPFCWSSADVKFSFSLDPKKSWKLVREAKLSSST